MPSSNACVSPNAISLCIHGEMVRIFCPNERISQLVLSNYAAFLTSCTDTDPALEYTIRSKPHSSYEVLLSHHNHQETSVDTDGSLLFHLEKDITVSLQKQKPDLLFLHAAAVEFGGRAILLVGASGAGKSTTIWGLLHHGFGYLTDELSAIDLPPNDVIPYPRALSLKRQPPRDYSLPPDVLDLGTSFLVPTKALPAPVILSPTNVATIVFVRYVDSDTIPVLRQVSAAEASARLYINALNVLAHSDNGLGAVTRLAGRVNCFSLDCGDLSATCKVVVGLANSSPIKFSEMRDR